MIFVKRGIAVYEMTFFVGMLLFILSWLLPSDAGWLLLVWGPLMGLSLWHFNSLLWWGFSLVMVMLPLLIEFWLWFPFQWYFLLLWLLLLGFVLLSYLLWWLGLRGLKKCFEGRFQCLIISSGKLHFLLFLFGLSAAVWTVVWFEFVSWVWRVSCGGDEGVFLFHPLLPLVSLEWVRLVIFFLTWQGTVFGFFSIFFYGALLVIRRNYRELIGGGMVLILLLWLASRSVDPVEPSLQTFTPRAIAPSFEYKKTTDPLDYGQKIVRLIPSSSCKGNELLIFPESCFAADLTTYGCLRTLLESLSCGRMVLCGAQRRVAPDLVTNCVFCFIDGGLVGWHDKEHLMPFFERLPSPVSSGGLVLFEAVFGAKPFGMSKEDRCSFWYFGGRWFTSILCSELFFTSLLTRLPREVIPLALVHDGWFCCSSCSELLWCMGALKAIAARRSLGYCSYRYAGAFDRLGRWEEWGTLGDNFRFSE